MDSNCECNSSAVFAGGFFLGFVCLGVILFLTDPSNEMLRECQKDLPRTEFCKIETKAVPR